MDTPTNRDLFVTIQRWLAQNYPGEHADAIVIRFRDKARRSLQLPLPLFAGGAASLEQAKPFEPTAYQLGILDALAGKALRVEALVEKVKDRPRFYRDPGGVKELQRHGLIDHDKRLGYYRPDAPPPELDGEGE